jgi:adenosylcobinamide kinase / adenosylcobinamide-phosphate guanylyltransferase
MEHAPALVLPPVVLVLGGARSGKSTHAEGLVAGTLFGAPPRAATYIATAEAGDVEMATRIMAHRARRGANWTTIEEALRLDEALRSAGVQGRPVLVDCLTLWLSNLLHASRDVDEATDELVRAIDGLVVPVAFVSNEVGLGIVPDTPLGRAFRDAQGRLNMRMAERADRVILMTAGLALTLKDRPAPPPPPPRRTDRAV